MQQHLDFYKQPEIRNVSYNALLKGGYKSMATDKPNSKTNEKTYSNRFFAKTSNIETIYQISKWWWFQSCFKLWSRTQLWLRTYIQLP